MELLNVREAAEWLRLSESELRSLRSANQGPTAIRVGRRVLFDKAELERFAASHTEDTSVHATSTG